MCKGPYSAVQVRTSSRCFLYIATMPPGIMSAGGGDSGAILAAMDAGVTPGPASARLPGLGPGGNGVHVQMHALAKIHDQKASPVAYS